MRLYLPTLASAAILLSLSVSPAVAAGTTCKASTAQEVGQCINQLNSGSITTIEVTAKINCTVDNKCQYNITTTKGGAIFGTPGSGAGFFRSGDYTKGAFGAPVFKLTGAANVTISNLLFDDNVNDANQPYCIESAGHPCDYNSQLTNPNPVTTAFWNSPLTFQFIYVENSNSITLRELNMTNCKRDSIHAINSNNLVVQNSVINNSFLRGIGLETINGALIEGNYFYINGGAGITGGILKNGTVKNNFFSTNQSHPPWNIGGGQINLGNQNTTIIGNKIVDSSKGQYYGCGVEFNTSETNLTIRDNDFQNNNGADICNNSGIPLTNVSMDNNRFLKPLLDWSKWTPGTNKATDPSPWNSAAWDLGGNKNASKGWVFGKNCFSRDTICSISGLGTLSIDPNPCTIEVGKTTCSVSISWFISFATNVEVKRGTTTIANWPTGFRRVVDGITTSPIPITLWGDGKLLATASVYAIAQGATPPPTTKPGDINGDGKVDITDYNILKGDFGKTGASGFTPSDINRDGKVDIFDYNIVITNAGK